MIESYEGVRKWIEDQSKEERWLDVVDCILDQSNTISNLIEQQDPQSADEFRYLLASSLSNAIDQGPLPSHNGSAADHWAAYLSLVSAPVNANRVDHAIGKLVQHARAVGLESYLAALWQGIRTIGRQLSGVARGSSGATVLNTLYRCDHWNRPQEASAVTVCASSCRPYFDEFLKSSEAFRNETKARLTADQRKLRADIDVLEQRIASCET